MLVLMAPSAMLVLMAPSAMLVLMAPRVYFSSMVPRVYFSPMAPRVYFSSMVPRVYFSPMAPTVYFSPMALHKAHMRRAKPWSSAGRVVSQEDDSLSSTKDKLVFLSLALPLFRTDSTRPSLLFLLLICFVPTL
jgi:hypothetical protein